MKNAINKYMRLYLQFRKAEGLAVSTLKGYEYHVKDLMKHIPEGSDDIRAACLEYLSQEGIAPNTFNYRRKYLSCFFSWCVREGHFADNPLKGIKQRKPTSRIINISNETIAALLELPDKGTFSGLRDYALMLLSVDCGLRPNEALSLKESDFDFGSSVVTVPAHIAKTRQSRTLPISPPTVAAVHALLSMHSPDWANNPVFCNNRGGRLGVNSWSHKISKYGRTLDVHIRAPLSITQTSATDPVL